MSMELATSSRSLVGAMVAGLLIALHSGCSDQSSDRVGGGGIPDLTAGSPPIASGGHLSEGGASGSAEAGASGAPAMAGPVPWCDAYKIINCVCQQCHQDPTVNGAAMPLMTFEDTQKHFPLATSNTRVWQKMQVAVTSRFMPYTADATILPTVQPLPEEQRDTLLKWLSEGAHDEGGTDCPMTCDWSDNTPEP